MRHLQQPLYATLAPTGRLLTLRSMLDFVRFDELYALRWQLRRAGLPMADGAFESTPALSPRATWSIASTSLPWHAALDAAFAAPIGGILTIDLVTIWRDEHAWAARGETVGRFTWEVTPPPRAPCVLADSGAGGGGGAGALTKLTKHGASPFLELDALASLSLAADGLGGWYISGETFHVAVDADGVLRNYVVDDVLKAKVGPIPSL